MASETHPRFAPFHRLRDIQYTTTRSTPVSMDIWIPRSTPLSSHTPVLLNWHGGGLMSGIRDRGEWWAPYLLSLATQHNAIILAPDYPLAPESQTPEILASIEALLAWLLDGPELQRTLDTHEVSKPLGLKADTTKLLATGNSAGGWCALWTGLKRPDAVRALVLQYPMLDMADTHYNERQTGLPTSGMFGLLLDEPESVVDEYLAKLKATPGAVRVSEPGLGPTFPLTGAAFAYGRVAELLGKECEETYPLRQLEKQGVRLPGRVWVLHGREDYVTPMRGSEKMVKLVERNATGTEVRFDVAEGLDHGFDGDFGRSETAVPVDERLKWIEEAWLA